MYIKILLVALFLSISTSAYSRGYVKLPAEAEIKKYCIPLKLAVDEDIHYFVWHHIEWMNEEGVSILYNKVGDKRNFFKKKEVLNFEEAKQLWQKILENNR